MREDEGGGELSSFPSSLPAAGNSSLLYQHRLEGLALSMAWVGAVMPAISP
jgi:hypothetical protein